MELRSYQVPLANAIEPLQIASMGRRTGKGTIVIERVISFVGNHLILVPSSHQAMMLSDSFKANGFKIIKSSLTGTTLAIPHPRKKWQVEIATYEDIEHRRKDLAGKMYDDVIFYEPALVIDSLIRKVRQALRDIVADPNTRTLWIGTPKKVDDPNESYYLFREMWDLAERLGYKKHHVSVLEVPDLPDSFLEFADEVARTNPALYRSEFLAEF